MKPRSLFSFFSEILQARLMRHVRTVPFPRYQYDEGTRTHHAHACTSFVLKGNPTSRYTWVYDWTESLVNGFEKLHTDAESFGMSEHRSSGASE